MHFTSTVRWIAPICLFAICPMAMAQATYELTFVSTWSGATHPGAYPAGAHFSSLIGGTHHAGVSYWELNGIASNAIEQMAETGGTTLLRNLVQSDINTGGAAEVVTAAGIFAPGTRTTTIVVSPQHPLLTLVTMVAPSPDWFVGVSGLDFRVNGQWAESVTISLETYDAGTDSGPSFTSPDMDVTPHEPISLLGSPLTGLPELGTFTFSLQSSMPLCDLNADGACNTTDLDQLLSVGPLSNGVLVTFGTNHQYDFNGDNVIDVADRDEWLAGAAAENGLGTPYSRADANLDGFVDGADFIRWNNHKFSTSLSASEGDFNADGIIDGADFIVWNDLKFTSSDPIYVPEPVQATGIILLVTLAAGRGKQGRAGHSHRVQ